MTCDCEACVILDSVLGWLRGPQPVDPLLAANNLSDVADPVAALANLGGQPLGAVVPGGAVDSVNGQTGVVVLDTADLADFDAAVDARISTTMAAGAGIDLQYTDADDVLTVNAKTTSVIVASTTDTLAGADNGVVKVYTSQCVVSLADVAVDHDTVLVAVGPGISVDPGGYTLAGAPKLSAAAGQALYVKRITGGTWIVIGGTS